MADKDREHHHHEHGSELSETQLRVRALETILTEKGYVDPAALDAVVEAYETRIGPHNGARVVAKAWADPEFKQALLKDATAAVGSLGFVTDRSRSCARVSPRRAKSCIDERCYRAVPLRCLPRAISHRSASRWNASGPSSTEKRTSSTPSPRPRWASST